MLHRCWQLLEVPELIHSHKVEKYVPMVNLQQLHKQKTAAMKAHLSSIQQFSDLELFVKLIAYHSTGKSPPAIVIAMGVLYCTVLCSALRSG